MTGVELEKDLPLRIGSTMHGAGKGSLKASDGLGITQATR